MMYAVEAGLVIVAFIAGVFVGDRNKPTVDAAIVALQGYELEARAMLAQITKHKAT